jgi:hypothetical protein
VSIPAEHLERMQGKEEPEQSGAEQAQPSAEERLAALEAENAILKDQNTKAQQALLKIIEAEPEETPAAKPAEPVKEPDWDNMSTKEIIKAVLGEVQKGQAAVAQGLMTELTKVKLQMQIERAAEKYDDFFEYAEDVVAVHKEKQGTITPEEAYILAKKRRADGAAAKAEAEKKKIAAGVKPGSQGAAKPVPPPKNMREAAKAAYAETFGKRA